MITGYIKRLAKRATDMFFHSTPVLMYHRINSRGMDPWELCVTPKLFEEQLLILSKFTNPIPLQDLTGQNKTLKKNSVVITFDDGYADNLYLAKPLLEKYSIPATFFISTGHINSSYEFWWDELEKILLRPGRLPDQLCLTIDGAKLIWRLGSAAVYTQKNYASDLTKNAWQGEPGTRLNFFLSIWQKLYPLSDSQRRVLLDMIAEWADVPSGCRDSHRTLTSLELKLLGEMSFFEIGAHGVTHPVLNKQNIPDQIKEIDQSRDFLSNIFGYDIKSFAYPHGEFTAETKKMIKNSGFTIACTTNHEAYRSYNDLLEIPRIQVRNWDSQAFHERLQKLFHH